MLIQNPNVELAALVLAVLALCALLIIIVLCVSVLVGDEW